MTFYLITNYTVVILSIIINFTQIESLQLKKSKNSYTFAIQYDTLIPHFTSKRTL